LRLAIRDCSCSISIAISWSTEWRSIRMPGGTLGQCATPERALEIVIISEAAQHDIDRALPLLDIRVADVGEHPSF
jgi:hypothetical protein